MGLLYRLSAEDVATLARYDRAFDARELAGSWVWSRPPRLKQPGETTRPGDWFIDQDGYCHPNELDGFERPVLYIYNPVIELQPELT